MSKWGERSRILQRNANPGQQTVDRALFEDESRPLQDPSHDSKPE